MLSAAGESMCRQRPMRRAALWAFAYTSFSDLHGPHGEVSTSNCFQAKQRATRSGFDEHRTALHCTAPRETVDSRTQTE